MSRSRILALAASVVALAAAGATRAQDAATDPQPQPAQPERQVIAQGGGPFRFNSRFRNRVEPRVAPGGPGNILPPVLPPGVTQTFPLTPFQQPDILRNYLQMRATSPRPNQFLGGQFNPQYRVTAPLSSDIVVFGYPSYDYGSVYLPPLGYNYGAAGGFAGGGYVLPPPGGAPAFYSPYGQYYPPVVPNQVVVQREIIYVRPEERGAPQARAAAPSEPASSDYYLSRPRTESLDDAVQEIRRAWLNGDFARLKARIRDSGKVRLFPKGRYQYSVSSQDFAQMTRDAMERIDTTAFDLDRAVNLGEGRAFVSGKHTYIDPDKSKHEVYVSFGLAREDGRWKIAEAGSSTTPIRHHEE